MVTYFGTFVFKLIRTQVSFLFKNISVAHCEDDLQHWCHDLCTHINTYFTTVTLESINFSFLMVQAIAKWRQLCVYVSSHMANHVERWAQRHGPGSGEMRSGPENLILLNMDAVFWRYVNLVCILHPVPQQTDVRQHTSNYYSNYYPLWLVHSHWPGCHFHMFNTILDLMSYYLCTSL